MVWRLPENNYDFTHIVDMKLHEAKEFLCFLRTWQTQGLESFIYFASIVLLRDCYAMIRAIMFSIML